MDRVWNYDVTGIGQLNEKEAAEVYKLQPGDFKATDVDRNGKYEALADKMFIGYRQPRFRVGLRNDFTFLKYFSASVFLRGEFGHMALFQEGFASGRNLYSFDKWSGWDPESVNVAMPQNFTLGLNLSL